MKVSTVLYLFLFTNTLFGQIGTLELISTGMNEPIGLKQLDNQHYISVSNKTNSNPREISVIKLNKASQVIWAKNVKLDNTFHSFAVDFIIDRDGNIVIVGTVLTIKGFILKINGNDGSVIFAKTSNYKNTHQDNRYRKIIQLEKNASDDYCILGVLNFPNTHTLTRLDKSGNFVWAKEYDIPSSDELAYALSESINGDLIVGCNIYSSNYDQSFIHYKASDGSLIRVNRFDLNYSTSYNGALESSVVIKGTQLIAYTFSLNGGSNTSKHGVLLYHPELGTIVRSQMYNISSNTARAWSLDFDSTTQTIAVGGALIETDGMSFFMQAIDFNDLKKVVSYKLKNINYTTAYSGTGNVSFDNNSNVLYSAYNLNKNPPFVSSKIILGSQSLIAQTCVVELATNTFNILVPNATTPNIQLLNFNNYVDVTPIITNQFFAINKLCQEICNPNTKLFRLNITKTKDTICPSLISFNAVVKITNNFNDTIINVSAYKKDGANYTLHASGQHNQQVPFNLNVSGELEEYMFIGQRRCSLNDTTYLTLYKHKLSVSKILHDSLYCIGDTVRMKSNLLPGNSNSFQFRWFDELTNMTLSETATLQFPAYTSLTIGLEINDNCSKSIPLKTTVLVAPMVLDSTFLTNKLDCEPLRTEFIHPITQRHFDTRLFIKWYWSVDEKIIDSTFAEDGQAINNKPFTFEKAGKYLVKVELKLSNQKTCNSYHDTVKANKRAIADFEFSPEVADITDTAVRFVNRSSFSSSYLWNLSDGTTYNAVSPFHLFQEIGDYKIELIAYNDQLCNDTIVKDFTLYDIYRIFSPNAFTPNGNGFNEVWQPLIVAAKKIELMVFNRWGEMIYSTESLPVVWDGIYKGEILEQGTYIYWLKIITVKTKAHYYKGTIELLR
jgi:gliding motility-associated-like protein